MGFFVASLCNLKFALLPKVRLLLEIGGVTASSVISAGVDRLVGSRFRSSVQYIRVVDIH